MKKNKLIRVMIFYVEGNRREMPIGDVSVGEVSVGDVSVGKLSVEELSGHRKYQVGKHGFNLLLL